LKKDKTRYLVAVFDALVVAAAWCAAWAIRWPILDHIPYPYHTFTFYLKAVPAVVVWLVVAEAPENSADGNVADILERRVRLFGAGFFVLEEF